MSEEKKQEYTAQEKKVIELMRTVGYGEIRVILNDGRPVRVEEIKKSILIS